MAHIHYDRLVSIEPLSKQIRRFISNNLKTEEMKNDFYLILQLTNQLNQYL